MITLQRYSDVVQAEMDKSLLEAADIPAFIVRENSAALGYGTVLGEIQLQVDDADIDRARQILRDKSTAPLPDDFVPPAVPSPETPGLKIPDPDNVRSVTAAVITVVVTL